MAKGLEALPAVLAARHMPALMKFQKAFWPSLGLRTFSTAVVVPTSPSASVAVAEKSTGIPLYYFYKQLLYAGLGLVLVDDDFAFPDAAMIERTEPGAFEILVGPAADPQRLQLIVLHRDASRAPDVA